MSISKRLSRANSIADDNNLVTGKLISVEVVTSEFVDPDSGQIEESEQIEWIWEVPTKLGKPTQIHEWTGFNLNSEKTYHTGKESLHNKLTTILIQTGLVSLKNIDGVDLESLDIESLIGQEFQFEIERRKSKKNIKSVKLNTLKLIKSI